MRKSPKTNTNQPLGVATNRKNIQHERADHGRT
jgi:hypothetical protein